MNETPTGWKPIETAPRDGTVILLWDDYDKVVVSGQWDTNEDDGQYWAAYGHYGMKACRKPTHWMPPPAGPAAGDAMSDETTAVTETDYAGDRDGLVMQVSRRGIWVPPDIPTDECARRVLDALSPMIQYIIEREVAMRMGVSTISPANEGGAERDKAQAGANVAFSALTRALRDVC